ncbi:MAG: FtsX-like permease family protein [Promethearchaeota archaeon]
MKKDWALIFCVSFCLSMVAGLSYFNESVQEYKFKSSLNTIADIEIVHYQIISDNLGITPRLGYSSNFAISDSYIRDQISESLLNITNVYQYGILTCEAGIFTIPNFESVDPSNSKEILGYEKNLNASEIKFMVSNDEFYKSDRFNDNFKLIQGHYPKNPQEILIDYNFAKKYGLSINENTNITLLIGKILRIDIILLKDFQLENITISGFYLPTQLKYILDSETFSYSYTYQDYLSNLTYYENENEIDGPAIFSWYNFKGPDYMHPFQKLYAKIKLDPDFGHFLTQSAYTRSGYILTYDRGSIDYNHLNRKIKEISFYSKDLASKMPWDVAYIDKLSLQLNNLSKEFQKMRYLIQLLNIPLFIFAILLNNIFNEKNNLGKIILTLRRKGVPLKVIKKQQLYQIFIYTAITSLLGLIFGLLTFYIYQECLGDLFYKSKNVFYNPKPSNFLLISFIGFILFYILNYKNLKKMQNLSFIDIAYFSNYHEPTVNYDERILKLQSQSKLNITTPENKIKNESNENFISQGKKIRKGKNSKKRKNVYSEDLSISTSKISKLTYILIILGISPLILNLIIYLGNYFVLSDLMKDFSNKLTENVNTFFLLSILGYILLIIGVTRIILIEKIKFFARFAKLISRPIVSKFNKILALRIIKKNKWSKITVIFVMFFGVMFISNILYNSQYRYEILAKNIETGADTRIEMDNHYFKNQSDIINFENSLKNITNNENEKIINNVVSCSIENNALIHYNSSKSLRYVTVPHYSVDLKSYLRIIQEGNKPLPYSSFEKYIQELLNFNINTENNLTGIFVSSSLLEYIQLNIGDSIILEYHLLDSNTKTEKVEKLNAKIIDVLDFVPGIYNSQNQDLVLTDINSFNISNSELHGDSLIELIDINEKIDYKPEKIKDLINPTFQEVCPSPNYQFYDSKWDKIEDVKLSIDLGESGFWRLFFKNLLPISIFIIIEISIYEFLLFKKDSNQNNHLLYRGLKRNKILRIFITESLIILFVSLFLGLILGGGYAWVIVKVIQLLIIKNQGGLPFIVNFPIYIEWSSIIYFIIGIMLIPIILFIFFYIIDQQKKKD